MTIEVIGIVRTVRGRRLCDLLLLGLLCVLLVPANVAAQERKGFWFEFETGRGAFDVSAGGLNSSREWTQAYAIGLGWALRPNLLAGLHVRGSELDVTGDLDAQVDVYNVMGGLTYYPRPASGFFVRGAGGGSFIDLTLNAQGTTLNATVGKGLGLSGGIGYDIYLGHSLSVTPGVTVWYGQAGDIQFIGQTLFTDWKHNGIDLTIGISFR